MTQQVFTPNIPEDKSVKLIGLGGIGHIAARYLSVFLAAQDISVRLALIDGDDFETDNLSRMMFLTHGNKAEVTKEELLNHFRDSRLTILSIPNYVEKDNMEKLIRDGDIVILCVDNHKTRKMVAEHCAKLDNVTLFSSGNDGVDDNAKPPTTGTYGNVQVYARRKGVDRSPDLFTYHPEIANPTDKLPTELHCTELIAKVPQVLFANLAVASMLLNTIWLFFCNELHYSEIAIDIAEGKMGPWAIPAPAIDDDHEEDIDVEAA